MLFDLEIPPAGSGCRIGLAVLVDGAWAVVAGHARAAKSFSLSGQTFRDSEAQGRGNASGNQFNLSSSVISGSCRSTASPNRTGRFRPKPAVWSYPLSRNSAPQRTGRKHPNLPVGHMFARSVPSCLSAWFASRG